MASIVLQTVGAGVGNALVPGLGSTFFGALGRAAGGLIDNGLGIGTQVTGPRLASLTVQDSRYGAGIPRVYGQARVAGNVIWASDLMQATHQSGLSGGKGGLSGSGASATIYTYSVHCAVGIAAGPIGGITTIWADSTVIYQNGVWTSGLIDSATLYTGTTTQAPDSFMQSMLGSANVPAYRGMAYIVLENLQLANFGNRLPNLTFEIAAPQSSTTNLSLLGSSFVPFGQPVQTTNYAGMQPIALAGSARAVSTVLVGGYNPMPPSTNIELIVSAYDVTGDAPALLETHQCVIPTTQPYDGDWALSPDGRMVAIMMMDSLSTNATVTLYDTEARQFGATLFFPALTSLAVRQIAWLDNTHLVLPDVSGGVWGVHVLQRAGLGLIHLGFNGVWGAGSATTRAPLCRAQFTRFAGGLLACMSDYVGPGGFTALYGVTLMWQYGALVVGTPYTITSGLSGITAGATAYLLNTAADEYTICYGNISGFGLLSFVPTTTGASLTRPWQWIVPGFGNAATQLPLFYGDRIVMAQGDMSGLSCHLTDVMLTSGSFAIGSYNLVTTTGTNGVSTQGIALDYGRFLLAPVQATASVPNMYILPRQVLGQGLDGIVGDILTRAGYVSGDFDVTALSGSDVQGYIVAEPMSARAAIEPLQLYAPFDLVETSGLLRAILRHDTADVAIPSGEWRATAENKPAPPALQTVRAQESELPRVINLDYIDASRDYEINSQSARRIVTQSLAVQKINLPVVTNSATAKRVAEARLFALWAERDLVRLSISGAWMALDVGDVVDLGNGALLRVSRIQQAGHLLSIEGFYVYVDAYESAAVADTGLVAQSPPSLANSGCSLTILDIPLLRGADNQPGYYIAVSALDGWRGGQLWRAADGVNYSAVADLPLAATAGFAVTALANGSSYYMDNVNSVTVQAASGSLSSCSLTDLLNGANAALLGQEIIQFQTATLTGPGLYVLGNLLRGRRGTEFATTVHVVGENFTLLTTSSIEFIPALLTNRNATYQFRALGNGQSLGDVQDVNATLSLATLRPFAPVAVKGQRASGAGTDLTLSWVRRARINAEWVDYIDVPLDEMQEQYDVEVVNGGTVIRTFSSITTSSVIYTAAEQSSDWGASIPASFTLNIYQLGTCYGRGAAATVTV
ncbi:MAG: phage tail protein [Alphaproteobacteria bacterium]|nr:phage tail protein [Alphaproteobacteria bacterium]MBV8548717.1 phage tail protein [Alphaproteobacteria bacterium]